MKSIPSQRAQFLSDLAQTNPLPLMLEVEKAQGSWITDIYGKKYLDLIAGIGVSALGHQHPVIQAAIKEQVDRHLHVMVYGEFIQSPQVDYATWLTERLPQGLDAVYFTNSGAEAVEGAMKLAKRKTGRSGFISCRSAYHGSTQGALSLAGEEWLKSAFRPLLPDTRQIDFNNQEQLANIDETTAAVVIELVQAEAGTIPGHSSYLSCLRKRCSDVGALLIIDEIQTGFGRLGTLFGLETYDIVPDILLLGKAIGGGLPLAAFIASQELMACFQENPVLGHITTFGGHPLSCAAGLAMAQELTKGDIIQSVEEKYDFLKANLPAGKLRGKGLLLSLELEDFSQVEQLVTYCFKKGIITDWFLFNDRSIRIAPPLNIGKDELDIACKVISQGYSKL